MIKKYYSLLEVKDYLLSQEVAKKCDIKQDSIIYLYGRDCKECVKQGYVLTEIKRKYPWVRIYSFDISLDFSIIDTFTGIYDIKEKAPILIINQEKYVGFHNVEEIESFVPGLQERKLQEEFKDGAEKFLLNLKDKRIKKEFLSFLKIESKNIAVFNYYIDTKKKNITQIKVLKNEKGDYQIIDIPYIDFLDAIRSDKKVK